MRYATAMHSLFGPQRAEGRPRRSSGCRTGIGIASCAIALALAAVPVTAGKATPDLFGFRLLDLEGVPVRWTGDGSGPVTVNYAFVDRPLRIVGARNCKGMVPMSSLLERSRIPEPVFRQEVRTAFDMWENAANIRFREVGDPATSSILIGAQEEPDGWAFTNVEDKSGHTGEIAKSLICLNPQKPWKIGFDGDLSIYDLRYTIAHEIGHAIGLDHPASGHGQLMSHRYQEQFRTLQAGDISGAVQLYGDHKGNAPSVIEVSKIDGGYSSGATALK